MSWHPASPKWSAPTPARCGSAPKSRPSGSRRKPGRWGCRRQRPGRRLRTRPHPADLATIYAAAVALGGVIGRPVTLAELLATGEPVDINDTLTIRAAALLGEIVPVRGGSAARARCRRPRCRSAVGSAAKARCRRPRCRSWKPTTAYAAISAWTAGPAWRPWCAVGPPVQRRTRPPRRAGRQRAAPGDRRARTQSRTQERDGRWPRLRITKPRAARHFSRSATQPRPPQT